MSVISTSGSSDAPSKSEMKCNSGSKSSGMPSGRFSPRRSKISQSAASHSAGGTRSLGRIFEACRIAAVKPRRTASSRNAEFRTRRAGGRRPKLMLDKPRMMPQFGNSEESSSIARSVSNPSFRSSSTPVAMVNVNGSMRRSCSSSPHVSTNRSRIRLATSSLLPASRAMPRSSIVSATHAAPYCRSSGQISSNRRSPSSRLSELTTHRPPATCKPASIVAASVESSMSGASAPEAIFAAMADMSTAPSRPTRSTHRSRMCAPPVNSSRAMPSNPSRSSSSNSRLNFREPFAFVRSATNSNEVS